MATSKLVRHMLSGSLRTGFCRLCLCEAPADCLTLSDNLSAAGGALTLAEVLRSVAPALLWHLNGMLSDKVCRECCQKATAAYHFQLQCQQTAATLHHCVAALHTGLDNSVTSTNKLYIYVKEPTTPLKEPIIELRSSIEKHTPNSKLLVNNSRINDQYSKVPVDLLPLKTQVKQENMSSDGESSDAGWRKRVQIKSELGAAADPGEEDLVMVVDEAGVPNVFRYADETKQHLLQLTDEEQEYFFCKHPHFRPRLKRRVSLKDVKLEKSQNSNKLGVRSRKRGLFSCKLCHAQFLACDVETFAAHCEEHTQRFNCDHCSKSFKYRRSIVNHLRNSHSWKCQMSSSANYTCYYCGKGYLCVSSFEAHIRKHEAASSAAAGAPSRNKCQFCGDWCETRYLLRQHVYRQHPAERPYPCPMCWRNFVNERALRWHQRLHTGERPFACEQCGKAFISLNRRNQHALTSHTQPTKQCPLCPALFHLRSMVNTHIRKVHLKIHKRLSRPPKYTEVEWATQKVPLEELSLHVQAELLQHKIEPRPYVQRGMEQF